MWGGGGSRRGLNVADILIFGRRKWEKLRWDSSPLMLQLELLLQRNDTESAAGGWKSRESNTER